MQTKRFDPDVEVRLDLCPWNVMAAEVDYVVSTTMVLMQRKTVQKEKAPMGRYTKLEGRLNFRMRPAGRL